MEWEPNRERMFAPYPTSTNPTAVPLSDLPPFTIVESGFRHHTCMSHFVTRYYDVQMQ